MRDRRKIEKVGKGEWKKRWSGEKEEAKAGEEEMKKAKTGRQRVQAYRVGDGWIGWVLCGVGKKQRLGKSSRGVMMRSTEYVCMYLYSFGIAILRTPTAPLSENERIDKELVRVGRVGLFFNWITAPNRKWLRIANLISLYVCTCTITIQVFKYMYNHTQARVGPHLPAASVKWVISTDEKVCS